MIALSHLTTVAVTAAPPLYRLLQLTLTRFYSAAGAAQPQLDPDYYHYSRGRQEACRDQLGSVSVTDTEGEVPGSGVQWVIIGSPRSKKHVYAEMLSKILEVPHITMASLVRQELSPHSNLYKQIANVVNHGELVQEDITFGLLSKRLEDGYYRGESGFILDGIPRTKIQAEIVDRLAEIDLVVNFKCAEDFFMKNQGGGSWNEKLQAYAEQSKALEDYYRKQRKLIDFQVSSAPVDTWRGLLTVLRLQHVNAAHSSKTLTAGTSLPSTS